MNRLYLTVALLLCVAAVGCLTGGDDGSGDPVPLPAKVGSSQYTGAIIYTSPNCVPCSFLKNDIDWLIHNHGWHDTDFVFKQSQGGTVPQIAFIEQGREVHRIVGYSSGPQHERQRLLREICRQHPLSKR